LSPHRTNQIPPLTANYGCLQQGPCHLSIAPELNAVLVAHYESGHVNLVGLDADGNVSQELASHCFQDGPYTNEVRPIILKASRRSSHLPACQGRQDGSHPHFIHYVPEANAIFVCDLGLNALHRLEYSCETATLRHCESLVLHPGAGPRHLAIQQRRLYILHELDNGITVVQLEGTEETASMTIVQVDLLSSLLLFPCD
jgi:6-phosphogluconolactonase